MYHGQLYVALITAYRNAGSANQQANARNLYLILEKFNNDINLDFNIFPNT